MREVIVLPASADEAIEKAWNTKSEAATFITLACWLEFIAAVCLVPFTMFGSLLVALAVIPPTAALGCIATNSKRQAALQKVTATLLASRADQEEELY